jgi:hypothetical protein
MIYYCEIADASQEIKVIRRTRAPGPRTIAGKALNTADVLQIAHDGVS